MATEVKGMTKKRKVLLIAVGSLFLLLIIIFLSRGFIREKFLPWYVSSTTVSKLENDFTKDFEPVNTRLKDVYKVPIVFEKQYPAYCSVLGYEVFAETINCYRLSDIAPITADDAFISHWKVVSPNIEKDLQADGWVKMWNAAQPIDEILDRPDNNGSIGVNYQKKHGDAWCTLAFFWIQPHEPNQLDVRESCERFVEIFGGY